MKISAHVAREMMHDYDALILDVRSQAEFDGGHMSEMGFVNVYDFGGIIDWPYETMITLIGG